MHKLLLEIMDKIDWEMREQGCYLEVDELMKLAKQAWLKGEY